MPAGLSADLFPGFGDVGRHDEPAEGYSAAVAAVLKIGGGVRSGGCGGGGEGDKGGFGGAYSAFHVRFFF